MLFITEEQVSSLLNWHDTFRAVEIAMLRVAQRRVVQKARVSTEVLNTEDVLLTMPGYLEDDNFGALACKLVTMFKGNVNLERPLPSINANIMVFDEKTGILNAIRIWGRNNAKAKLLVDDLNRKMSTDAFMLAGSNERCVREADVIITATYASTPIVRFEWVKTGAHINAVGCGVNHYSELDEMLYLNSDVYVDYWAGAHDSLAKLEEMGVQFKGEVGDVIGGGLSYSASNRTTVFQSLGMAVEDGAMARMIINLHRKNEVK